jgi:hypothetical protein
MNSNDFVAPDSGPFLFIPGDVICQWVYNKPKFKKLKDGTKVPNTTRRRIGYICAAKDEQGYINIGWSKCASHDSFDFDLARNIAYGRLMTGTNKAMPSVFKSFLPEFELRSMKYFQTDLVQEYEFFVN